VRPQLIPHQATSVTINDMAIGWLDGHLQSMGVTARYSAPADGLPSSRQLLRQQLTAVEQDR